MKDYYDGDLLIPYADFFEKYNAYTFLKFMEKKEYMQDFIAGKLFFNTVEYFAKCEEEGRGDSSEGLAFQTSPMSNNYISANLEEIEGKLFIVCRDYSSNPEAYKPSTVLSLRPAENMERKLICFYRLDLNLDSNTVAPISPKMAEQFGEYGVIIVNPKEFIRRVTKAISNTSNITNASFGFVKYLDENAGNGFVMYNPFIKNHDYAEQKEFRFTLSNGNCEPYTLEVGDLSDIVKPMHVSCLNEIEVKGGQMFYPVIHFVDEE